MYYEYSVKDGVLHLKGSDNVSLCRGFYDYVKTHRLGMYTWSGNNIRLPEELPAASSVRVESPFRNHYYFNVCTYGYTMPYWDWARWEQEIDWMALQHKILDRMRALGMKPICPGFPGFIPEAFRRIYPDLHIVETHWGGAFHNWMISPTEPLFAKISEAFIKEWEKEFGKCDYYLVDSFNEMDIPFPEKGNPARYEMAASYGEKVYSSIKRANKDAVWVMQGWMFGYQRHIWDYETLGALVSRVPDDKMLLLDLAVDYNRHFWHSEVNWE